MISQYLHTRLKAIPFAVLAVLFSFLLYPELSDLWKMLAIMLLLLLSFLVFRLVDDLLSHKVDRKKDDDRAHLSVENFPKFRWVTFVFVVVYLSFLFLLEKTFFLIILAYLVINLLAYVKFADVRKLVEFLPLVKYPLLSYGVGEVFGLEVTWSVIFSSFFLMLCYDFLDHYFSEMTWRFPLILLVIATGCLLLQPWYFPPSILYIALVGVAVFAIFNSAFVKFIPTTLFPILFLIQSHTI